MTRIKNAQELVLSQARYVALEIIEAGFRAINTRDAVKRDIRLEEQTFVVKKESFPLRGVKRIFVVGIGKCALEASMTLETILGSRLTGGIVIDVHKGALRRLRTYAGTHPVPTEGNVNATKEIILLLQETTEDDLVIFVISGGGSTFLCQPGNFTCGDEATILDCLTKRGARIEEINTVRKHLSLARGGYLAKYAYPSRVIALIFSDVVGDKLEFIASGPTVKDVTTVKDAEAVLFKYDRENSCGFELRELIETPKEDMYFKKVTNLLFLTNKVALQAMADKAKELGFSPKLTTATLTGEARDVGLTILEDVRKSPHRTVLLYGGETTVTVKGKGKGGRNQELGLSVLQRIEPGQVVLAVASDGRDNSEIAGVLCDSITRERAEKLHLDFKTFLNENASYKFWSRVGDYLLTGDTGSNVADLVLAIHE